MAGKLYELGLSLAAKLDPSLTKSFSKASGAVSDYDRSINNLSRHQNNLDRLMRQRDATMKASQAYNQAKLKVAELASQMKQAKSPSAALKAEFDKAKIAVSKASQAYEKQLNALRELRHSADFAGKSIKQLKAEEQQLALAAEKAARAQKLQQKVNQANSLKSAGASRMTSGMGQIAGMAGMGMALTATLKPGMDLEKQMSSLAATSNLTNEQLAQVQERATLLGRDTILSADQAAIGITKLVRAGYDLDASSKAMDAMGHIAVMTGKDFAEGTDFALQALKTFKLDVTDAGRVSDVFANAMSSSGLTADQMAEKFSAIGPVLSSLGLSLEESAGMMAAMDKLGIKAEGLKKTMTALKAPTNAQAKALNALGVSAVHADGSAKSMTEILQDLGGAINKLPEESRNAKLTEIFGARDFATAKGLIDSTANGSLPNLIKAMSKSGSAEKMATKLTDNLAGDFAGLGSAISFVAIRAFEALQPLMRATVQTIANAVTAVGNFIKEHQTLAKVIGTVALGIGSFLAVVGAANLGLGALMWTVGSGVGTVLKLYSALQTILSVGRALTLLMVANPIGAIITGITALIAIGVLLYKNWDTIKEKAGQLLSYVSNIFMTGWTAAWEGAKNVVSNVFNSLVGIVKTPINAVIELINKMFASLGNISVDVPDWIPGLGGKNFSIGLPQIPMLANGGVVTSPTLAMIGEGKEDEAVLPLSQLESMMGGSTQPVSVVFSPNITINGNADSSTVDSINQAMRTSSEQIRREIENFFNQRRRLSYV